MPFALRQLVDVLKVRNEMGQPYLLIGGQAVNYWAERYLVDEPELNAWLPFTSEDIDFQGQRTDVEWISRQPGLKAVYPHRVEMTALAGCVPFRMGEARSNIEVVRSLPGLTVHEIEATAFDAEFEGQRIRVLDPVSLLWCKPTLTTKVPQRGRQDENHVRIMVVCVRAFLRETLRAVAQGELPIRGWLGAVERVLRLAEQRVGRQLSGRHGVNWRAVLPWEEIALSQEPPVVRLQTHRLALWQQKIARYSRCAE